MKRSGMTNTLRRLVGRVLCAVGLHRWKIEQETFASVDNKLFVIGWKECHRCYEGRVIHVLQ